MKSNLKFQAITFPIISIASLCFDQFFKPSSSSSCDGIVCSCAFSGSVLQDVAINPFTARLFEMEYAEQCP